MRIYPVVTVLLGSLLGSASRAENAPDPYTELLQVHGMTTGEDIRRYLEDLHLGPDARAQLAVLIRQLGDDQFAKREEATLKLLRKPMVAPEMLVSASEANDLEVRWRANHVLKHQQQQSGRILYAVFYVIADRDLKGLAREVAAAIPFCREEYLEAVAAKALKATAAKSDLAILEPLLGSDHVSVRGAVCEVIESLVGAESDDLLIPLLKDPDLRVRFQGARALANHGNRKSLLALGELLESEDLKIRTKSVHTLRALTGRRFQFIAYEHPLKRLEPARAWRSWIEREGATAKLKFPLTGMMPLYGRTLICNRTKNMLMDLDANGKVLWTTPVTSPYGCDVLPNGHRVVASYSGRFVAEYDAAGKEIWKKTGLPTSPYSVRWLSNGNKLVACYTSKKVLEIRPDKTIAWEVALPDKPKDARRLDNGNTLVALYTKARIIEIDRVGKIVWEIPAGDRTYSAQRLENGNTLVCQYTKGAVVEYDRTGRLVWSISGSGRMYDAQRLPNGNTLFVDTAGAHEVAPGGDIVWEYKSTGLRRALRY